MSDDTTVRAAIESAISEALRSTDGAMLTRWVLLAEVIEGDSGGQALWCLTPVDMKAWETLGLLTYAVQLEQAGIVADRLEASE